MGAPKFAAKRKYNDKKSIDVDEQIQNEENDSEEILDSETEDLLVDEVNNDGDTTDEEAESTDNIVDSDTEKDELVFGSDDESKLEFESDEEEDDDQESASDNENDDDHESVTDDEVNSEIEFETDDEEDNDQESESDDDDENIKNDSESNDGSDNNTDEAESEDDSKVDTEKLKTKELPSRKKESKKQSSNAKNKTSKDNNTKNKSPKSKNNVDPLTNKKLQTIKNVLASIADSKNGTSTNEYDSDTSDEEDIRNTVGNIPMKWYDEFPHVGYDWEGKKILKPEKGDQLDNFLKRMEDPDFWRTIKDPQTGQDVVLAEADIELITRIQQQKVPDAKFDEYGPWVEWFTSEIMKTPLRNFPEHKRSFLPSKSEAKKVSKMVHALKMGWMKSTAEMEKEKQQNSNEPQFYLLWKSDDKADDMRRIHKHIPAPKRFLPGHAESYNPPSEYLFDKKELKQWDKLKQTPWKRKLHFIPQKFESLRTVPAYSRFIKERFQRCLDLYLAPRAIKMKLTIQPEDLVPQLPSPRDLQPFPTTLSMIFKGHSDMVRSMTVEAKGQYLATGSDDMTLKIWEIATGRCIKSINCGGIVRSVAWCPNQALSLIAVAAERKILLINPNVGDHLITEKTDSLLEIIPQSDLLGNYDIN